jgi:hypothetical protein
VKSTATITEVVTNLVALGLPELNEVYNAAVSGEVEYLDALLVVFESALLAFLTFEALLAFWLDWFEILFIHFFAFLSGKLVFISLSW